jgi:hypothetical protein
MGCLSLSSYGNIDITDELDGLYCLSYLRFKRRILFLSLR